MKKLRIAATLLAAAAMGLSGTASADDGNSGGGKVLALGDSVAFGYISSAGYEYVNPDNFLGFPSYLGWALGLDVVNAACPGETTGHFLSATQPDNGCASFSGTFPLHVAYKSTQLAFATSYLKSHRDVRLVTITLGANDGFLLEASCKLDPGCIEAGLPGIGTNIAKILVSLRATGYAGAVIVMNYYSTDYTNPSITGLTSYLNQAIAGGAAIDPRAAVADVFTAFQTAAAPFGQNNDTCAAGLLNVTNPIAPAPPYACDIHPTLTGQRLIAETIAKTYRAMGGHWY